MNKRGLSVRYRSLNRCPTHQGRWWYRLICSLFRERWREQRKRRRRRRLQSVRRRVRLNSRESVGRDGDNTAGEGSEGEDTEAKVEVDREELDVKVGTETAIETDSSEEGRGP